MSFNLWPFALRAGAGKSMRESTAPIMDSSELDKKHSEEFLSANSLPVQLLTKYLGS